MGFEPTTFCMASSSGDWVEGVRPMSSFTAKSPEFPH